MATGDAAESVEETVAFPDWVVLDRYGRTYCHDDLDSAREAANEKKTAVEFVTGTGHRCCLSFTLSDPPKLSYLDIHWPLEGSAKPEPPYRFPAYPYLRAADEDLVLFEISMPNQPCFDGDPSDLFVYTAAGPSPSVQQLPLYTEPREWPFLRSRKNTGILRLAGDRYIVADLRVYWEKKKGSDNYSDQGNGGLFPVLWKTNDVLAFDGRFLCWVDHLSGVLLCDFPDADSPVLHFVPFPGGQGYPDDRHIAMCLANYYRRVSISQGIMRFVDIDHGYHERVHVGWRQRLERGQGQQHPPLNITIWTLKVMGAGGDPRFEWEVHRVINLDCLWSQRGYQALGMRPCLPEFPVVPADDPDALCCLLRDEKLLSNQQLHGHCDADARTQSWMIMVDMNHAYLRSCTEYINQQPYGRPDECVNAKAVKVHENLFSNTLLLPAVFSKYLERPKGKLS
ncbi:uncharacterized protein [Aegilops tauschii subsp. strangulata]|uniref:uncharacterized protein n=1 Tax=Aegilops tauschii subsp. strangulata TaxID=200361 RepID=UPI000989B5D9|nr:uncharacterized protein LOC109748377 [Aegilops tauschii subsp. strangulata]XP_044396904.1 uncharacterized protein LOC123121028 [Triticum aestivum]